jgi:hypothetical protein
VVFALRHKKKGRVWKSTRSNVGITQQIKHALPVTIGMMLCGKGNVILVAQKVLMYFQIMIAVTVGLSK